MNPHKIGPTILTLSVHIDMIDQAKFCEPRNVINMSSEWSKLWRPSLHVSGVKVHGVAEYSQVLSGTSKLSLIHI